jgi:hypothetical protein
MAKRTRIWVWFRLGATFTEGLVTWSNQPATSGTAATAPSASSLG